MHYINYYNSPIGKITIGSDSSSLIGLWFEDAKYFGSTLSSEIIEKNLPIFEETKRWLDIYFSGNNPDFTPKLKLEASKFRLAVWNILLKIPYGQTTTYGEIAKAIAEQKGLAKISAQAVGGAVGYNPVSIIIPCHRVIGKNGNLTGYAGGLDLKRILLDNEKQ